MSCRNHVRPLHRSKHIWDLSSEQPNRYSWYFVWVVSPCAKVVAVRKNAAAGSGDLTVKRAVEKCCVNGVSRSVHVLKMNLVVGCLVLSWEDSVVDHLDHFPLAPNKSLLKSSVQHVVCCLRISKQ